MYHNLFIHSFVNGYLGGFHVLVIVNSAEINNGIHESLSNLVSSGYIYLGMGLLGFMVFLFLVFFFFFKDLYIIFHSGCIHLHSSQQYKSIFSTPSPAFTVCRHFFPHFFKISWRLITLQYCSGFCHTLT